MPKQDSKRHARTLHVKAGRKIEFPVAARHPLAKFQRLTPVRSAADVNEFLMLWARKAAAQEQPTPDKGKVLAQIKKAKLRIFRLFTSHLRIEKGAVLRLNNPLNQLDFDTVTIAGDLVVRGDLILNCSTLTLK